MSASYYTEDESPELEPTKMAHLVLTETLSQLQGRSMKFNFFGGVVVFISFNNSIKWTVFSQFEEQRKGK